VKPIPYQRNVFNFSYFFMS